MRDVHDQPESGPASGAPGRPAIRFRTLNGVGVEGAAEDAALQPKRLLLLAFLLLEGREGVVRREQLLALFWPDADAERARNALRQALFGLRTLLGGDAIQARGGAELVVDRALVTCDALDLLDAVDRGDHGTVAQLYRSEFLPGVAGDSAELDQWLEQMRTRLRHLAAMALRALAGTATSAEARRAHLARLLELLPYDEPAVLRLITTQLELGDRPAAVETYRRFSAQLREDLDLEPSAALTRLIEGARAAPDGGATPAVGASAGRAAAPGARARPRTVLAALALMTVATVLVLAGWLGLFSRVDPTVVDVSMFETVPGDTAAQRVAGMIESRVRGTLTEMAGFHVLDRAAGMAGAMASRRARPGTIIRGGVERRGPRWVVWASVTASESSLLLQRAEASGVDPDTVALRVIDRVAATVGTRRDMALRWGETLHRPGNVAALLEYQAAFEAVAQGDGDLGVQRFREAWRLDSMFLFAGLMAANNALNIAQYDRADSLLRALAPHANQMLPLERAQFQRIRALFLPDLQAALAESREIVKLEDRAPFLIAQYAQDAYLANRPAEALQALDLMPANLPNRDEADLPIRTSSLHLVGRFRDELRTVDRAIANTDGVPHLLNLRLPPLAALGEADTLRVILEAAVARQDNRDHSRLFRAAGLELLAHGHEKDGQFFLARAADVLRAQPAFPGRTLTQRLNAAELLYEVGRDSLARQVLEGVEADTVPLTTSQRSVRLMLRGLLAARAGDVTTARAWSDSLSTIPGRWRFGVESYRRARIAAMLGDVEQTVRLLEQSNEEGFVTRREVHLDINFAAVRRDPRFRRVTQPRG